MITECEARIDKDDAWVSGWGPEVSDEKMWVPRGTWFGEKAGEMLAGRKGKGLGLKKVGLELKDRQLWL